MLGRITQLTERDIDLEITYNYWISFLVTPLLLALRLSLVYHTEFRALSTLWQLVDISLFYFMSHSNYGRSFSRNSKYIFYTAHNTIALHIQCYLLGTNTIVFHLGYLYIYHYVGLILVNGLWCTFLSSVLIVNCFIAPLVHGNWTLWVMFRELFPLWTTIFGIRLLLWVVDKMYVDNMKRERENLVTQSKNEVFKIASHELRNPLQALTYSIQHMSDLGVECGLQSLDSRFADNLDDLSSTVAVLNSMVENVLDFNMIETKKLELRPVDFDIQEIMERVVDVYCASAQKKGLELHLFVDPRIPSTLNADPVRLTQIISNFCINAIKFTQVGSIDLRAELESICPVIVKISCKDTGTGIKQMDTEKLFKPFSRISGEYNSKGWGLGLCISAEIINKMNGIFGVNSEFGVGSTFWVSLPFEKRHSTTTIAEKYNTTPKQDVYMDIECEKMKSTMNAYLKAIGVVKTQKFDKDTCKATSGFLITDQDIFFDGLSVINVHPPLKLTKLVKLMSVPEKVNELNCATLKHNLKDIAVLLVEDDKMISKMETKILQSHGMLVKCAYNGQEGLSMLLEDDYRPDIILVDNQMPIMNGAELVAILKSGKHPILQKIPIVMTTGTVSNKMREEFVAYNVPILQKPTKPSDLLNAIQAAVLANLVKK